MYNTNDSRVIIHIPFQRQTIRLNGADRQVLSLLDQGFAYAEYADGNSFPISNPFGHWVRDMLINAGIVSASATNPVFTSQYANQNVYFILESAGARPNPGQDDNIRSLIGVDNVL